MDTDPRLRLIREQVRDIPDFPKPGILFRDITPLLASHAAFEATIELLTERYGAMNIEHVIAIESRGFIFGAPLASRLGVGLHLVRKPGKLPAKTAEIAYELEYGTGTLQMHDGELKPGGRALIVDDLLATGGTAAAATTLAANQGAAVIECAFIIELEALQGRARLGAPAHALLKF